MKITITTETDGKKYTCCMDRGLEGLSKAKCNDDWMTDDFIDDGSWVLSKNVLDGKIQNIDFNFKMVNGQRTLEPIDAVYWDYDDLIDDTDLFNVKVS